MKGLETESDLIRPGPGRRRIRREIAAAATRPGAGQHQLAGGGEPGCDAAGSLSDPGPFGLPARVRVPAAGGCHESSAHGHSSSLPADIRVAAGAVNGKVRGRFLPSFSYSAKLSHVHGHYGCEPPGWGGPGPSHCGPWLPRPSGRPGGSEPHRRPHNLEKSRSSPMVCRVQCVRSAPAFTVRGSVPRPLRLAGPGPAAHARPGGEGPGRGARPPSASPPGRAS